MLKFHAAGDWLPEQVSSKWVSDARRVVPDVEALIDHAWQMALRRPGVKLFDGPMCRMERWRASSNRLEIDLSPTSYRTFFGTNLAHPELAERFGTDVMGNPAGVSPALLTADNFLLMGRRNGSVAYYPNRVHPFAGALEPQDAGDVFRGVRRELAEELSLGESDIAEVRCTGIAEDQSIRQPELIFRVRTRLSRGQIESQVDAEEHRDSLAVEATPEGIAKLVGNEELTPIAVASLLLWGKIAFGVPWFEKMVVSINFIH